MLRCLVLWAYLAVWATLPTATTSRQIDIVSPVAGKDAVTYRYSLRHALKHVRSVRHVYVVCRPTPQLESVVAQANMHFASPGQKVILVDEASFPMNFENIRGFLRTYRPTEGLDGQPFNGQVAVPRVCNLVRQERTGRMVMGPYKADKELIDTCRQPFKNETKTGEWKGGEKLKVFHPKDPEMDLGPYEVFDRTGWMLQQFLKLGAGEAIPGILEAYMVIDADTVFYNEYHPFPIDDTTGEQYNYVPGDPRDCGNPPYFMTSDRLAVGPQPREYVAKACAGKTRESRRCKDMPVCPIAHQMIYRRDVLRGLFAHIEREVVSTLTPREAAYLDPAKRAALRWWEAILLVLPAWHTSPFSEYIMYFQYATTKHPHTVRLYDNAQLGATEDEVPANYFMDNGKKVGNVCGLTAFAAARSPAQRQALALTYCDDPDGSPCLFYRPEDHDGRACPAPLYRSYHGFRNSMGGAETNAYREYDLEWLAQHAEGK